jgi:hypothetical protein
LSDGDVGFGGEFRSKFGSGVKPEHPGTIREAAPTVMTFIKSLLVIGRSSPKRFFSSAFNRFFPFCFFSAGNLIAA